MPGFNARLPVASLVLLCGCWDFAQLKQPLPGDDMSVVLDDLGLPDLSDPSGVDFSANDLTGVTLDLTSVPDLGACSNPILNGAVRYVNFTASPGGDGTTPATAFQKIAPAIDSLQSTGGNILIASGEYSESLVLPAGRPGVSLWGGWDAAFACRANSAWPPATSIVAEAGKAAMFAQSNIAAFNLQLIGTDGDNGAGGARTVAVATDGGGGITASLTQVLVVARKSGGATPVAIGIDARNTRLVLTDSGIDVAGGIVSTGVQACGTWVTGLRLQVAVDGGANLARGIYTLVTPPVGNCIFPTGNVSDRHVDLTVSIVNAKGGNAYGLQLEIATPATVQLSSSGIVSRAANDSVGVSLMSGNHRLTTLSSTVTTQRNAVSGPTVVSNGAFTFEPRDSIFDGSIVLDLTSAPTVTIFDTKVKNLYYTTRPYLADMAGSSLGDLGSGPTGSTVGIVINGVPTTLESYRATYDPSAIAGQDPQFTAEPPGVTSTSPARNAAPTGAPGAGCNGVLFSYNRMNRPTADCDIGAFEQ